MGSQLLYALARIRTGKLHSFQIGLVIFVAVVLCTVSVSIMTQLDGPFAAMFERLKGSQLVLSVSDKHYDRAKLTDWFQARPELVGQHLVPTAMAEGQARLLPAGSAEEIEIKMTLTLAEYDPASPTDRLEGLAPLPAAMPAAGEVWVPNSLANRYAMRIGDRLKIPVESGYADFRIGAIVVDPHYSGLTITSAYRVWIGRGELAWHFSAVNLVNYDLHVRFRQNDQADTVYGDFVASRPRGFTGGVLLYSSLLSGYGFIFKIIAVAMLVFSGLTMLIAVFVVYTSITGAIASDYKNIGILKSIGFGPGNVVAVFTLQFSLIALLAIPPGLLLAWGLSGLIAAQFMSTVSVINSGGNFLALAAVIFAAIQGLLSLCALVFARRAGRIKAVDALRLGESSLSVPRASRSRLNPLSRQPIELILAIKQFLAQKRRNLFIALTALLCAAILTFMLNFYGFMQGTGSDLTFWGFPAADAQVDLHVTALTEAGPEEYAALIRANPRVAKIALMAFGQAGFPANAGMPGQFVFCDLMEGSFDDIGFSMLEGKNPQATDEIALSAMIARQYGKQTGDSISLTLAGRKREFRVCGVYQSTNMMGKSCRMSLAAWQQSDPSVVPDSALVWLREPGEQDAFIQDLRERYGATLPAKKNAELYRAIVNGYIGSSSGIMVLTLLVLLVAVFAVIWSNTSIELEANRRNFGIYKTLGLTPAQLRLIMVFKTGLVTLVSALAGALLITGIQGSLIQAALGSLGIMTINLPFHPGIYLSVIGGITVVAAVSTWFASKAARHMSVRHLIVE